MMGNLDNIHICDDHLRQNDYFQSLIDEARRINLLTDKDIENLQRDLLLLLSKQIEKFTQGKSSSIPIEKAQSILESICYVISLKLKNMELPIKAVEVLKEGHLYQVFDDGLKIIQFKQKTLKKKQQKLISHLFISENVFYNTTIIDGLHGFFQLYNPEFMAQEIHITADYPTSMKRPNLKGIEFIEKYFNYLEIENTFCHHFDANDVHYLLCGLTVDYPHIPFNFYEPILLSALGLILTNHEFQHLDLTENDINQLYHLFHGKNKKEIYQILKEALLVLHKKINLSRQELTYTHFTIYKLVAQIKQSLMIKTLDKIFLVPVYPENMPQLHYNLTNEMSDFEYQQFINELIKIDNYQNRVAFILEKVHSLTDLLDIINEITFNEEELYTIIHQLSLIDFAVLLKQYPSDDFLENDNEVMLYRIIEKRKNSLSIDEKNKLNVIINMYKI